MRVFLILLVELLSGAILIGLVLLGIAWMGQNLRSSPLTALRQFLSTKQQEKK